MSGSFLIGGNLHAPVGADPLVDFDERPPMVALTDAWIEFWSEGQRRVDLGTGTLVVNRHRADLVWPVTADELAEGLVHPARSPSASETPRRPSGHPSRLRVSELPSAWLASPTTRRANDVAIPHTQPARRQSGRPARVATKPMTTDTAVHKPRNLPSADSTRSSSRPPS